MGRQVKIEKLTVENYDRDLPDKIFRGSAEFNCKKCENPKDINVSSLIFFEVKGNLGFKHVKFDYTVVCEHCGKKEVKKVTAR